MDDAGFELKTIDDYQAIFEKAEIRFPIQYRLSEKELFVLLSLFSRSEIIGLSIDDSLKQKAATIVPSTTETLIEKKLIHYAEHYLVLSPEVAVFVSCVSSADKTIVFTNDSLDASKCNLSVYVKGGNLLSTIYKIGDEFEIRVDSDTTKFSHFLFSNYFQTDSYHTDRFIDGISSAFSLLSEESNALDSGCDLERFFCFKIFDKNNPRTSDVVYNFVQIEDVGTGIYELEGKFLKHTNKLSPSLFQTEKTDVATWFAEAFEVMCNAQ